MNQDELLWEEMSANWRDEGRRRAKDEADAIGLEGEAARDFVSERAQEIYEGLYAIALEMIE